MASNLRYTEEEWKSLAREADYRAEQLAKKLNIRSRQLRNRMKKDLQQAPQQFLDQVRMEDACPLLQQEHSVKVVAGRLGFKGAAHFSHKFHHHYGLWPTEYLVNVVTPLRHFPSPRPGAARNRSHFDVPQN